MTRDGIKQPQRYVHELTMASQTELLKSIDDRLKMLQKLEFEDRLDECDTNKEKVLRLQRYDLDTKEMAQMIGTSPATVRATKSDLREEGKIDD